MTTSVALCTYNGERFLKQQIDSILNQTICVDEIIVCDDGSKDKTLEILADYKNKFPELFKIYINEKNLRSVKNFEKAISLCTKDIIFLCDQDDVWLGNKVEIITTYFRENKNINALATNGFAINEDGKQLDVLLVWDVLHFLRQKYLRLDFYKILNVSGNFATGATMAFKNDFLPNILPFPIVKDFHHDEWIALVASIENKFDFLDIKTIFYRKHNNQQVGGVFYKNSNKQKKRIIKFFNLDYSDKSFSNYKFLLKRVSKAYLKNNYLLENSTVHKEIFEKNTLYFKDLFNKLKNEMRHRFIVRFLILSIFDSIKGKRSIK